MFAPAAYRDEHAVSSQRGVADGQWHTGLDGSLVRITGSEGPIMMSAKSEYAGVRVLRVFHGDEPDVPTLAGVYALTLVLSLLCLDLTRPAGLAVLQGILCLDLIGGVLFNLTDSTKRFWQARPRAVRLAFLAGHVVQPLLLGYFLSGDLAPALSLFCYVFVGAVTLEMTRGQWNRIGSVASCMLGIFVFAGAFPPAHAWFPLAYLGKLLISFSIKTD